MGSNSSGDLLADRRFALANMLSGEGDDIAAAGVFEQTLELAPDWAPAWLALGLARGRLGQRAAALDAFRQACALDKDSTLGASVLSTPGMIGMMERTAAVLAYGHLPEGSATVGFEVCVKHVSGAAEGSQVEAIATALGRDVPFAEITRRRARARMAAVFGAEAADAVLDVMGGDVNDELLTVRDTVPRVTGTPGRPFRQWATENATAFR